MLLRLSRRLGLALGIAFILGLALPGVASADVLQRFAADSGDRCLYGFTNGHLNWSSTVPVVAVSGTIVDNPVDRLFPCIDDGRISVAHFIAYAVVAVDRGTARADNSAQNFAFRLGAATSARRLTHVTVQVCRYSTNTDPDYCGPLQTYRNPA
jgi:hypothetical protein